MVGGGLALERTQRVPNYGEFSSGMELISMNIEL